MRIVSSALVAATFACVASAASAQTPPPASPLAPPTCQPACRAGYVCSPAGECVSACNPPCGANEVCTADAQCAAAPFAVPATPPPGAPAQPAPTQPVPAPGQPAPFGAQPGVPWGTPVGPGAQAPAPPRTEAQERRETGRQAILPRGLLGLGLSIGRNEGSGFTNRSLLFPIHLRAPMGSLELEVQFDHVLGVLSPDFGDTLVAYSFGNPYLGLYGSFGRGGLFIESGLGIAFPAAQTEGDGGLRPATLAAGMLGLWDFYRFIAVGGDDFVGIVPHVRGDLVVGALVAAVELDLPFMIPIGDTRDYYDFNSFSPLEAMMQISLEAGFRFLGSSVLGGRLQHVVFLSEGWSDRYQAALEPFFRIAPRGRGYLRLGLMINLGQVLQANDVVAFSLTTGTIF